MFKTKKVESTFYTGKFSNGGGGAFVGLASTKCVRVLQVLIALRLFLFFCVS